MSEHSAAIKLNAAETIYRDKTRIYSFKEPFLDYAESEFGRYHFTQDLRFKPYKYDNHQMLEDLGNDVQPLLHMPFTHDHVIQPMLRTQIMRDNHSELNPENINLLRQAAYFHDMGENEHPNLVETCGSIVGDIDYPSKIRATQAEREERENAEKTIRQFFYAKHLGYMSDDQLEKLEQIVGDNYHDTYEKQFFDTAEHLGYFGTAMRAAEIALANTHKLDISRRIHQLGRMAVIVGNRWFEDLGTTDSSYPHVTSQLQKHESTVIAINARIKPCIDLLVAH
ncbi:MAG: hypothetical protein ACR2FM_01345 [Candidatus Saccharimonadales bacterium]